MSPLPFPSAPGGSELHRALLAASGIENLILKRAQQTEKQVPSNTEPQAHITMRRRVEYRACFSFVMDQQSTAPPAKEASELSLSFPRPRPLLAACQIHLDPGSAPPPLLPLPAASGLVRGRPTRRPAARRPAQLPAQCTMRNALASSDAISSHLLLRALASLLTLRPRWSCLGISFF